MAGRTVAVMCPNLFHEEVEGSESLVTSNRTVADRDELDALLARGVQIHARCYCGHATSVTRANALLVEPVETVQTVDPD